MHGSPGRSHHDVRPNRTATRRKLGRLDYACGLLSIGGTIGWLVTRQGLVALAAAVAADALAGVPTLVKSWRRPESESANVYLGAFASAVITLLTVKHISAPVVAFPLYIAVLAFVETALVAGRLGPRWRGDLVVTETSHDVPGPRS